MLFRPVFSVPDVISAKVFMISEVFVEVTWFSLMLSLTLAYFVYRTLLWQWRVGCYGRRYVLVTGCDTGFGFELVKKLDSLGFRVFAGCLTSDGVERVTQTTSRRVMPLSLDVTDSGNVRDVVECMTSAIPPQLGLWAVVNNAGVMPTMAPLELTPRDCFERTVAVNLMGTVEVTRACLPLVRRSRGRIVNVSSVSGRLGFTAVDYTVSKFAVEGFSDCLRREVLRDGLRVSIITPGGFKTNLCNFDKIFSYMHHVLRTLEPEVLQHFGKDYVTTRKRLFDHAFRYISWGSSSLDKVLDAYVHAISARYPRTRYVVGLDATFIFQPLWLLPDFVCDYLLAVWPLSVLLR